MNDSNILHSDLTETGEIEWLSFVMSNPGFGDLYSGWHEIFSASAWIRILGYHPEYIRYCNCWDKFEGWDWALFLSVYPDHAGMCNWDLLKPLDIYYLHSRQPDLIMLYRPDFTSPFRPDLAGPWQRSLPK